MKEKEKQLKNAITIKVKFKEDEFSKFCLIA